MSEKEQVALPKELVDRIRPLAEQLGFESVSDLVAHLLERVLSEAEGSGDDADKSEVIDRLRDLGYL